VNWSGVHLISLVEPAQMRCLIASRILRFHFSSSAECWWYIFKNERLICGAFIDPVSVPHRSQARRPAAIGDGLVTRLFGTGAYCRGRLQSLVVNGAVSGSLSTAGERKETQRWCKREGLSRTAKRGCIVISRWKISIRHCQMNAIVLLQRPLNSRVQILVTFYFYQA